MRSLDPAIDPSRSLQEQCSAGAVSFYGSKSSPNPIGARDEQFQ